LNIVLKNLFSKNINLIFVKSNGGQRSAGNEKFTTFDFTKIKLIFFEKRFFKKYSSPQVWE